MRVILLYLIIQQLFIFSRISFDEEIFAFLKDYLVLFELVFSILNIVFKLPKKFLSNLFDYNSSAIHCIMNHRI